jgi:5-methylcytosine-specific restriction endonuclease McrA
MSAHRQLKYHRKLLENSLLMKIKKREGKRELREKLMRKQRGRCYYCKGQMVIATKEEYMNGPPMNAVTLEHTVDRMNPLRGVYQRFVAACWKCNNDRGSHNPVVATLDTLSSGVDKQ